MQRLHTLHRRFPGQDAHILARALRQPTTTGPDGNCDHLELIGPPHHDETWEWLIEVRGAWYLAIVRGQRRPSRYTNPKYNLNPYALHWAPIGYQGAPRLSDRNAARQAALTAAAISDDRHPRQPADSDWTTSATLAGAAHNVNGDALIYVRTDGAPWNDASEIVVVWGPDRPWAFPFPERSRRWHEDVPF